MESYKFSKKEPTSNLFEIKIELNRIFNDIVDRVNRRRKEVLARVEEFLSDYEVFRKLSAGDVESSGPTQDYTNFEIGEMPIEEFRDAKSNTPPPKYYISCDIEQLERHIYEFAKTERVISKPHRPPVPPKRSQSVPSSKPIPLQIGGRGTGTGCYDKPRGIGISEDNIIVLADQGRQLVSIISHNGIVLSEFKQESPYGVCVRGDKAFVSDLKRDCVFLYSLTRMSLERYSKDKGVFQAPKGLDFDKQDGILYIADSFKHSIIQMNIRLEYLGEFGSAAKLNRPEDVKMHPDGRLCVLDHGENGMLHIFNTYGHKLQTITKVNKSHIISTIFFCVDRDGNFVISDTDKHSLTVFDRNGDIVRIIGQEGERLGDLKYPRGVCCRMGDNRYFAASSNEKFTVQMF